MRLIAGVAPAIPLAIIRPFLPESPQWEHQRIEGTLKRPSVRELFSPEFRRVTIVTALLFACAYGAAFGTIQQSPQITPGLREVAQLAPRPSAGKRSRACKALRKWADWPDASCWPRSR